MTRYLAVFAFGLAACASDDAAPPTPPTDLAARPLGAGAHLTWKDNSADEAEFVIMRQQVGTDAAMAELARVPFDGVAYHDEPITSGVTYVYMVIAINDAGDSSSNQTSFVAP